MERTMEWTELLLTVPSDQAERAADIANMVVPYGLYIEDYSDLEQGAREVAHTDLIDEELLARDRTHAVIHLYISPEESPAEALAFLEERLTSSGIVHEVNTKSLNQDDWANNWKRYFKPLPVGKGLLICPTWEKPPAENDRALLNIDPGMAFGTGGHETTRLVLETLEEYINGGEALLDVGCGSGILSIAALLLGAKSAFGVDIDPLAVKTAVENGRLNGMYPPEYTMVQGNLVDKVSGRFDIIVANIVADAIIALSKDLPPFIKPNGIYIASGIIDTRVEEVQNALGRFGFEIIEKREQGGWAVIVSRPRISVFI
jgi:ribosomal protein L11 methyltransferase